MNSFPQISRQLAVGAAVSFIVFFIWIVVIANQGNGTPWWSFIDQIPYGDKVGHLGLIGTMSFLCNLAFYRQKPAFLPPFITTTSAVILVLLTAEELSQAFIKTRHLDLFDWLADLAGLGIGQFCAMKFRRFLKSRAQVTSGPPVVSIALSEE